jgi:hypothetical protein
MLLGGTVGVALEEAVMRVGYKDEMVFLFLPDEDGVYKVWRTGSSTWSDSELAKDARTYVLIDPPGGRGRRVQGQPQVPRHQVRFEQRSEALQELGEGRHAPADGHALRGRSVGHDSDPVDRTHGFSGPEPRHR